MCTEKAKKVERGRWWSARIRGLAFILDVMGSHWRSSARAPYEEQTGTECRKHWWFPRIPFNQPSAPKLHLWVLAINTSQLTLLPGPATGWKEPATWLGNACEVMSSSLLLRAQCTARNWGDTTDSALASGRGSSVVCFPLPTGAGLSSTQGLAELLPLLSATSLTPPQVSHNSIPSLSLLYKTPHLRLCF